MVTPLIKHKIVKKRTAKFNKFQSDRFKRIANVRTRPRCSKAEVKTLREIFISLFASVDPHGRRDDAVGAAKKTVRRVCETLGWVRVRLRGAHIVMVDEGRISRVRWQSEREREREREDDLLAR